MHRAVLGVLSLTLSSVLLADDASFVISDGDVGITHAEFAAIMAGAPKPRLQAAATDLGERYELINALMRQRKLAATADELTPDDDGYWDLYFKLNSEKENFMFRREMSQLEVPDFEPLALEYYETLKDKYASKPEKRTSSHILLASPPGLDRTEVRAKAQGILDELRAGADWNAMVAEHSEDPGSAARDGALSRAIVFGDANITPPYSEALFKIPEVGAFSEITDTQFGIHIIRLDGIEEGGYYPYEEVKAAIYKDIEGEWRNLAAKEIRSRYHLTDDAYIDGPAMDAFFAPYK